MPIKEILYTLKQTNSMFRTPKANFKRIKAPSLLPHIRLTITSSLCIIFPLGINNEDRLVVIQQIWDYQTNPLS